MHEIVYIIIIVIIVEHRHRNLPAKTSSPKMNFRSVNPPRQGCSRQMVPHGARVLPETDSQGSEGVEALGVSIDARETKVTTSASSTRGCSSMLCYNFILAWQVRSISVTMVTIHPYSESKTI